MFRHTIKFIKNEIVFVVAAVIAAISAFFVRPSKEYFNYIDFRVLALLLSLMLVTAGLRRLGTFEYIINKMIRKIKSVRTMEIVIILVTFFSSMLITNDVALITFVPFSILLLKRIGMKKHMVYVISVQTIAANLGSMVTPIGNPQNLYLYTTYNLGIGDFFSIMWLPSLISLVMVIVVLLPLKNGSITKITSENTRREEPVWHLLIYIILFIVCILCVLNVIDYRIMLVIVALAVAVVSPRLFLKADYILLLTFVMFFIFVGNLKRIPLISNAISSIINNHELIATVGISQVISNVPAAVLLSGFTTNFKALLLGTNIGGLGTLIASMASLISFRIYQKEDNAKKSKYILVFSILSVIFLLVLLSTGYFIER